MFGQAAQAVLQDTWFNRLADGCGDKRTHFAAHPTRLIGLGPSLLDGRTLAGTD